MHSWLVYLRWLVSNDDYQHYQLNDKFFFRFVHVFLSSVDVLFIWNIQTSFHRFVRKHLKRIVQSSFSFSFSFSGAIAVISMMTGNVVDRLSSPSSMSTATMMMMSGSSNATAMNSLPTDPWAGVRIASTLGFTVGLVQVIENNRKIEKKRNTLNIV